MPHRLPDDIVPEGKAIYEGLRAQLEQTDWGKFAVIDVYSGDKWTQGTRKRPPGC